MGANCGLFSLFGRGENPDLFIVSIEASTLRYQTLSSNWALQPSERWLCLHTAVGDRGVETHLSRHGSGFGHIIRPRLAPRWRSGQRRIGATVLESDGHDQRYGSSEAETIGFLEERGYRVRLCHRSEKPAAIAWCSGHHESGIHYLYFWAGSNAAASITKSRHLCPHVPATFRTGQEE